MKFETRNLKVKLAAALLGALGLMTVHATPWFQTFYNPDGSAQTNALTFTAYPPVNTWVVVGTNMYYGAQTTTFTPNSSGYVSNQIAPNTYSVLFTNLNSGFLVVIPNTTNVFPLSAYVTNVTTVSGTAFSSYGMITNWLGYNPATNGGSLAYSQLPYTPPTNSYSGLTNVLGFVPATNNPATNTIVYVSNVTGITNAIGVVTNLTLTYSTNTINYQLR